jgi:DNA-binding LacI/PurR family transcriptional regulator
MILRKHSIWPVCGFDGITLMGYVGKQMNTVRQDFYNIASSAVRELKRLFEDGTGRTVITKHELVKLYYKDVIV